MRHPANAGVVSVPLSAVRIAREVASALDSAHRHTLERICHARGKNRASLKSYAGSAKLAADIASERCVAALSPVGSTVINVAATALAVGVTALLFRGLLALVRLGRKPGQRLSDMPDLVHGPQELPDQSDPVRASRRRSRDY